MYKCCRCGYSTHIKTQYVRHLNRKNPCKPKHSNKNISELLEEINKKPKQNDTNCNFLESDKFECIYCTKEYNRKCHLSRHLKTCKVGKKMQLMENKISDLTEKIKELSDTTPVITHNTTHNTTHHTHHTTHNTLNVTINNYGYENMNSITSAFLNHLITIPYGSVPNLVGTLHFGTNNPENRNIKIENKKLPYASIYKDGKWQLTNKKECLEDIVDRSYMIIDLHYSEGLTQLEPKQKERYEKFQNLYDNDDPLLKKRLVKDTELVILNKGFN